MKNKLNAVSSQIALALFGKKFESGVPLRLYKKEDEKEGGMEDGKFFVAVSSGEDAPEVRFDGNQTFIGPFDSPESARSAVGSDEVSVFDHEGNLANASPMPEEDAEMDADLEKMMAPMESTKLDPKKRMAGIIEQVVRDLKKESGDESLEIDTSVVNGSFATDGAAGALDTKGVVDTKTVQTPVDAGGSTDLNHDAKPTSGPDNPGVHLKAPEQGAMVTNDKDASGAGDGKSGASIHESVLGLKAGNLVKITETNTGQKVDSGLVEEIGEGYIRLHNDETKYWLSEYSVRKLY
jgi:hypothetical protein